MPIIPIPVGRKTTVTMQGRTIKKVLCQHCSEQFLYLMVRKVSVTKDALMFTKSYQDLGAAARQDANQQLDKALQTECDPVHCPMCGKFQDDMVKSLRNKLSLRVVLAGVGVFVAYYIAYWTGYLFKISNALASSNALHIALIAIVVFGVLGLVLVWTVYDPNNSAEKRKNQLNSQVLTPEKLQALLPKK